MKLKRQPDDFHVEELTDVQPRESGEFTLYRLTKRGLGTPEAIEAILRRWELPRHRVNYGGLKDKHAVTVQHLTIRRGPRRDLKQTNFTLHCLGQVDRTFDPSDIRANRFQVVLRALSPDAAARALTGAAVAADRGLPNYFDDQRFGSVSSAGEFIGKAWMKGNYERCLWLALAEEHPFDRSDEKTQKRILREYWGRWPECKAALARSHRRSIITFLADRPGDFRGAWARVNVDLRRLYLSAYQSELWNRILATFLRANCPPGSLHEVRLKTGSVPFCGALDEVLWSRIRDVEIPLPSARLKLDDHPLREMAEQCVAAEGLEWRELRVKYPRDSFLSKGFRRAIVVPEGLTAEAGTDELEPSRQKVTLRFTLPRGVYATILVKRLQGSADHSNEPDDADGGGDGDSASDGTS